MSCNSERSQRAIDGATPWRSRCDRYESRYASWCDQGESHTRGPRPAARCPSSASGVSLVHPLVQSFSCRRKIWWRRRESNRSNSSFSTSTYPILRDKRPFWFLPLPPNFIVSGSNVAARSRPRLLHRLTHPWAAVMDRLALGPMTTSSARHGPHRLPLLQTPHQMTPTQLGLDLLGSGGEVSPAPHHHHHQPRLLPSGPTSSATRPSSARCSAASVTSATP